MDNENLYIGCGDGQLKALDINSLENNWIQQLDGPVTAAPLVSTSEVILGTASRKLYRINKKGGQIIQKILLDGRPRSQPVYHKQKIYIAYEPDYLAVLSDRIIE
jgi:outer membrane protein assembly factor BamB